MTKKLVVATITLVIVISAATYFYSNPPASPAPIIPQTATELIEPQSTNPIVVAAREQLINPANYSGAYYKIEYPMGDVPTNRGACTDVVIRALRKVNIDLQKEVQEDADQHLYPKMLLARDKNIDHRRCPNQILYFSRHAEQFSVKTNQMVKDNIQPGDIIFWKLPGNLDHVGIASDKVTPEGYPYIIHNIGPTVSENNVLFAWKIVAHFRIKSNSQT